MIKISKRRIGIVSFIIASVFVIILVNKERSDKFLSNLPLEIPFDISQRDSRISEDFVVSDEYVYDFKFLIYFETYDPKYIESLIGTPAIKPDGSPVSTGLPIPVNLSVVYHNGSESQLLFSENVSTEIIIGHGVGYYEKLIKSVRLKKGKYTAELRSLQDIPEFSGRKADFQIIREFAE